MTVRQPEFSRFASTLGLWAALLAVETGAQVSLKIGSVSLADLSIGWGWLSAAVASPWIMIGVICYVLAFPTWMLILNRTDLSLAFPLTGVVYIAVMLISVFGLHEDVQPWRWIGVGLIVVGIVMLGRGES
jgi:multidrug transporter EmrE-like cation transporter